MLRYWDMFSMLIRNLRQKIAAVMENMDMVDMAMENTATTAMVTESMAMAADTAVTKASKKKRNGEKG